MPVSSFERLGRRMNRKRKVHKLKVQQNAALPIAFVGPSGPEDISVVGISRSPSFDD